MNRKKRIVVKLVKRNHAANVDARDVVLEIMNEGQIYDVRMKILCELLTILDSYVGITQIYEIQPSFRTII